MIPVNLTYSNAKLSTKPILYQSNLSKYYRSTCSSTI